METPNETGRGGKFENSVEGMALALEHLKPIHHNIHVASSITSEASLDFHVCIGGLSNAVNAWGFSPDLSTAVEEAKKSWKAKETWRDSVQRQKDIEELEVKAAQLGVKISK